MPYARKKALSKEDAAFSALDVFNAFAGDIRAVAKKIGPAVMSAGIAIDAETKKPYANFVFFEGTQMAQMTLPEKIPNAGGDTIEARYRIYTPPPRPIAGKRRADSIGGY